MQLMGVPRRLFLERRWPLYATNVGYLGQISTIQPIIERVPIHLERWVVMEDLNRTDTLYNSYLSMGRRGDCLANVIVKSYLGFSLYNP